MKIIKTAQLAAAPASPAPAPPMPAAPTPAAAGLGAQGPAPQDNSARSQLTRALKLLSSVNLGMLQNEDDKEFAGQIAQQLKLMSAQFESIAKRPGIKAPAPQVAPPVPGAAPV